MKPLVFVVGADDAARALVADAVARDVHVQRVLMLDTFAAPALPERGTRKFLRGLTAFIGWGALLRAWAEKEAALHPIFDRAARLMLQSRALDTGIVLCESDDIIAAKECYMLRGPQPVRFIFVLRDGRHAAADSMKTKNITMANAARIWRARTITTLAQLITVARRDVMTVHVEDLAASPEILLPRIQTYLGLAVTVPPIATLPTAGMSQSESDDFHLAAGWLNKLTGYK